MRTPKQTKEAALIALKKAGIDMAADFHSLHSSQVDEILKQAIKCKYQKPTNANGSRARYFFYSLSRLNFKQALGEFSKAVNSL